MRLYLDKETSNTPSNEQGTFDGFELTSNKAPASIGTVAKACQTFSAGRGTAIIVVLADSRFDRLYAAFCDCLNRKYVEAGALPIVTLLYTDMGRMAETLCGFFSFQEEGTPVLATGRNVDFFCPK